MNEAAHGRSPISRSRISYESITMIDVASVVLPIFGMILVGWIFARFHLINEIGVSGLMIFVINLAIPALLFSVTSEAVRSGHIDVTLAFSYFLAAILNLFIGFLLSRYYFKNKSDESVVFGFSATFGNAALLGVPLISRAYGDVGLATISLILIFHVPLLMGGSTAAIEIINSKGKSVWRHIFSVLTQILQNPLVIGVFAGIAWGFTGYDLPTAIGHTVNFLREAATPLALFAVGANLIQFSIKGDFTETAAVSAMKLFLMPIFAGISAILIANPSPLALASVITIAALPSGVNPFILASKFNLFLRRAAGAILLSTMISIFTITFMIFIFIHY